MHLIWIDLPPTHRQSLANSQCVRSRKCSGYSGVDLKTLHDSSPRVYIIDSERIKWWNTVEPCGTCLIYIYTYIYIYSDCKWLYKACHHVLIFSSIRLLLWNTSFHLLFQVPAICFDLQDDLVPKPCPQYAQLKHACHLGVLPFRKVRKHIPFQKWKAHFWADWRCKCCYLITWSAIYIVH